MRVTLTAIAVPTVIPEAKATRYERCDWCGGKFNPQGDCRNCHRPA